MSAVLEGSLAAFKLPEILTFLESTRKSGTLTISSGIHQAFVFFSDGALVYAGSNDEELRLSAILLRKKRINRDQFNRIDALMRTDGGRFGQLAVQEGLFTEAQLNDFLKVQVSEIIYDCFVWTEGRFTFADVLDLPIHAVTISIDLANLIMEGARRIEEWEQCLRLLPEKTAIFRVISAPTKDGKITLTINEWKILFLINAQRTLEDLCHDAEEDPFEVYRVVYGLYANNLIEVAPREIHVDDTGGGNTGPLPPLTASQDDTMRQAPAVFHAESTIREVIDDTNLLVSSDARLSFNDMVKPTVAQLAIVGGEALGTVIPLTELEYLIGRQRDNNIQLTDLGISGFHARLYRGPDGFAIEDLKSRNGTWLNGTRVFHAVLNHGDRLRLGATELAYEVLFS